MVSSPCIIAAMGSHGGATIGGQFSILASYGITEEKMGIPAKATMDVVKIGKLKNSMPVYFNRLGFNSPQLCCDQLVCFRE